MAICIEPQAMPEACLPREVLFGHVLDVVDDPTVRFVQLPQYVQTCYQGQSARSLKQAMVCS
jgi:hypothetical protein